MSEVNEGQEPVDNEPVIEGTSTEGSSITSLEDALKELERVRKEAASRRVLSKEQEKQLQDYEAWKLSQMTEIEKAQAKIQSLEAKATEYDKLSAAKDAGLDLDLAGFVTGTTSEEMLASAKVLAEKLKGSTPAPNTANVFAGRRGEPVTNTGTISADDLADDAIRRMMRS